MSQEKGSAEGAKVKKLARVLILRDDIRVIKLPPEVFSNKKTKYVWVSLEDERLVVEPAETVE